MKLSSTSLYSAAARAEAAAGRTTSQAAPATKPRQASFVMTVEEQNRAILRRRRERMDALLAAKAAADHAVPAIAAAPAPSTPLALLPPAAPPAPPAITAAERECDNARALVAARAMHGRTFAPQRHTMDAWMAVARLRARRDGCDIPTALLRCGFVTADLSVKPDTGGAAKA